MSSRRIASTVETNRSSVGGRNPTSGHQQDARVELVGAVVLRVRAASPRSSRAPAPRPRSRRAERAPALDRALAPEFLVGADGAVERDPCHHLGVGEVPVRPAHLPDAGVFAAPAVLEPLEQLARQRPDVVVGRRTVASGLVERVDHLAVDVELQLLRGGVADAHGARPLEPRQPVEHALVEAPLAGDPVHDLDIGRDRRRPRGGAIAATPSPRPGSRRSASRAGSGSRRGASSTGSPSSARRRSHSGSEVVGAATIPPVGAYVRAFSSSSDWWISSW